MKSSWQLIVQASYFIVSRGYLDKVGVINTSESCHGWGNLKVNSDRHKFSGRLKEVENMVGEGSDGGSDTRFYKSKHGYRVGGRWR